MIADSYTMIPGSAVRHVDVGSVLNITCLVVNYPLKLDYVIFYHNDKVTHHVPQTCERCLTILYNGDWSIITLYYQIVTPNGIYDFYKEGVFSKNCAILSYTVKHCFHVCCQCCLLLLTNVLLQQINKDTGPYTMWVKVDVDLHHIVRASSSHSWQKKVL